ncbi:hypothetical protein SHKM778_54560 [Streptomyces sp. KM77-8]|uniref:Formamidopyrimidine-DNA glycosylase catalytic domain-containing protein n=1 Tax=Streptomyces haneummycinicus TaxID=3074435 RepID=A0AAT9HNN7_9ACTN
MSGGLVFPRPRRPFPSLGLRPDPFARSPRPGPKGPGAQGQRPFCASGWHSGGMPELPEVEALRSFLSEQAVGLEVVRVLPVAVSVLKTFAPPLSAVEGHVIAGVRRYGKFLGLEMEGGPFLVTHLARGGGCGGGTHCPVGCLGRGRGRSRCGWRWRTGRGSI